MCSRGKTFPTLGFLHAPAHGEAPVFLNYVIQRALQRGLLPAVPRHVRQRFAREQEDDEEGYMGEDEEDAPGAMDEEKEGKRKRRKRAMGSRQAQIQKGALTLTERRQINHTEAQRLRGKLRAGQGEHEEGAGPSHRGKRAARSDGQGGSGKRGRR